MGVTDCFQDIKHAIELHCNTDLAKLSTRLVVVTWVVLVILAVAQRLHQASRRVPKVDWHVIPGMRLDVRLANSDVFEEQKGKRRKSAW